MTNHDFFELFYEELTKHGLMGKYSFKPIKGTSRLGWCSPQRRLIAVSMDFVELNSREAILDVIRHEIAHALVPAHSGHGKVWKQKAIELGCEPYRKTTFDIVEKPKKYTTTCPKCLKKRQAHSIRHVACGLCCKEFNGGKFTTDYLLTYEIN
jgi:predicted SprT family Zn-dependent metalloprotease